VVELENVPKELRHYRNEILIRSVEILSSIAGRIGIETAESIEVQQVIRGLRFTNNYKMKDL